MKRVILDLCIVDTGGNVDIGLSYPFSVHAVMLSLVVPTAEVAVCNIGIKAFPAAGQALLQAGTITRPAPALVAGVDSSGCSSPAPGYIYIYPVLRHAQFSQVALR